MVSLEVDVEPPVQVRSVDTPSSPRISFSSEFLDENNFISFCPKNNEKENPETRNNANAAEFEFLLSNNNNVSNNEKVLTADELFFEGKLVPFWQMQHLDKLNKISLNTRDGEKEEQEEEVNNNKDQVEENSNNSMNNNNWFVDDDPSPRPPKCTVLWKELLRLKKQRASSSLSPSSSSSSSSSGVSLSSSLNDVAVKGGKRAKKVLERTRSGSTIRIRPMINVPICTSQVKSSSALPPLFPTLKK